MNTNRVRMHCIDEESGLTVIKQLVYHVPAIGDKIRLGSEKDVLFYRVTMRVWVYNEDYPNCVNIGVIKCKN